MNAILHEEHLRVTRISLDASSLIIFSGVPIDKYSFRVNDGKYYATIKAHPDVLPVKPSIGQHWKVRGSRKVQERNLDSYIMQEHVYEEFEYIECSLPETNEELINFIANEKGFPGIGHDKARRVCEALGEDFHNILSDNCLKSRERLRASLKEPLTENAINSLFTGYNKYKNLAHCNWMSVHKIPFQIQQRLLKYHDEGTIKAIKNNPYLLVSFGMTFQEVDHLVSNSNFKFEIANYDHRRLSAALEFALRKKIKKGHTYTTQNELKSILLDLFNGDNELVSATFRSGYNKAQYILNPDTGYYHPTAQLVMENVVAKRLKNLANQTGLYDEDANKAYLFSVDELPYLLTKKQLKAVKTCLDNAVSCITGGAGTGKTTVLRTVLRAYSQLGFRIHAVALSGRAAMRLHESIGFETATIAKMLRCPPIKPDLAIQKHVLVIDEASMIDIPTMYRLITHIDPSVRIIFTGDPQQLPPIGCGKVLSDIVESKVVANTVLDIVKRQDGATGIPEYSRQIKQGSLPEKLSRDSIYFHETSDKEITNVCCELYRQDPDASRIVAPTKALVSKINKLTQDLVNSTGALLKVSIDGELQFVKLKLNDVIVFDKNNYSKDIRNGTLGTLSSVTSEDDKFGEITLDTGRVIKVDQTILDSMSLGYAITLHKAQGSQFKRVIIAIPDGLIIDRSWLYTAITRAEEEVHIVGSSDTFKNKVKGISHAHNRNSYLHELLRQ